MNKKFYKLIVLILLFTLTLFRGAAENNTLDNTIIGDKNAKITVKEYLSLTCSHCSNFHTKTFPRIKNKLNRYRYNKIRINRLSSRQIGNDSICNSEITSKRKSL